MGMVSAVWLYLALILAGFSGGVIVGVMVDVDTVVKATIKKIKQKNSSGEIVVDMNPTPGAEKSKKEIRKEKRENRRAARRNKQ